MNNKINKNNKIELFDIDKLAEYEVINKDLVATVAKYNAHMYGHYVFDYPFIIKHLTIPNKSIIDFGCGFGALNFYLADRDCEIWAMDRDDVRWFIEKHPNLHFVHGRVPDEIRIEDGEWDYVTAASSIEHNEPDKIKQIFDYGMTLLKPGGKFIATVVALPEAQWCNGAYCFSQQTVKDVFNINADFSCFDRLFEKFKTKFNYPYLPMGVVVEK